MSNYVYMLLCKDLSLYTGYTTDLERRIQQHNAGKASKCTRSRLPVEYIFYHSCDTKSEALKLEYKIKSLKRSEKINLIQDELFNLFMQNKEFDTVFKKIKNKA